MFLAKISSSINLHRLPQQNKSTALDPFVAGEPINYNDAIKKQDKLNSIVTVAHHQANYILNWHALFSRRVYTKMTVYKFEIWRVTQSPQWRRYPVYRTSPPQNKQLRLLRWFSLPPTQNPRRSLGSSRNLSYSAWRATNCHSVTSYNTEIIITM